MLNFILTKIFGSANDRIIKSFNLEINKINLFEEEISKLSDDDLKKRQNSLGVSLKTVRH